MAYPMTPAFRPVCRDVHNALKGGLPSGPFNFGLYFMKWFFVADGLPAPGAPRPKKAWACCLSDETRLKQKDRPFDPNIRLDNLEVSLALFNGEKQYTREVLKNLKGKIKSTPGRLEVPASWDRPALEKLLRQKHQALEAAARSFERLGYEYHRLERHLTSPLILGLGLEHPSEKGFRFDWTLGLPVIPAGGIKGVVRLAWLVNELNRLTPQEAQSFASQVESGKFPPFFRRLFGDGGEKDALRGGVVFLDAYPQVLPRLKADIMNCHYPDYLNKGRRGPTEDQRPNPQKFWAVAPCADKDGRQPLTFVFRLLLAPEVAQHEALKNTLREALDQALSEHGLGAKTAVGHGRFALPESVTPDPEKKPVPPVAPPPPDGPSAKLQELLARLPTVKPHEAGQVAFFLDGMAALEDPEEKAELAQAVLNHFNRKTLKKHKRWEELQLYVNRP